MELDGRLYYAQTRFSLGGSSELPDIGLRGIEAWPDEGPALASKLKFWKYDIFVSSRRYVAGLIKKTAKG